MYLRVIAWLAVRAGARLAPRRPASRHPVPAVTTAALTGAVTADRAGRLVPVPDEPEVGRSLLAHWALWAAVALILLVLAAGYVRRRWRSGDRLAWRSGPVWDRNGSRK